MRGMRDLVSPALDQRAGKRRPNLTLVASWAERPAPSSPPMMGALLLALRSLYHATAAILDE